MDVPATMTAARMHTVGGELKLEQLPTPKPGDMDVLVRVRACGIVPNLGNILKNWPTWFPHMPQPPLPAVFGLDPAGEIVAVGRQVHALKPRDRVYINPGRSCGTCRHCRRDDSISCKHYAFQGYFGFSEHAMQTFADYPMGGLSEYTVAPASAIVKIPDSMTYEQAARLGYLGTVYSALKKVNAGPGDTILVNGISGTLGIGAAIFAPAVARSATEAFLCRRLETLAKTKGWFFLNERLPIAFDASGALETDLLCADARVAIELDGAQHLADADAYRRDRRKDRLLQENGYFITSFCAFWPRTRGKNLDRVLDAILRALNRRS